MAGVANPLERLVQAIEAYCRVVDRHRAATVLAYANSADVTGRRTKGAYTVGYAAVALTAEMKMAEVRTTEHTEHTEKVEEVRRSPTASV